MPTISEAILFCPNSVTGGPEAIHQLNQTLNKIGVVSHIAYYGGDARIELNGYDLVCSPPSVNPCLTLYSKYNPTVFEKARLSKETIIILPEVLASDVDHFKMATVAVWWLSVDNAFLSKRGLASAEARSRFFSNHSVWQFCQTYYSRQCLQDNGLSEIYDLVDYTDDLFTSFPPRQPNAGLQIVYNPKKGAELSAKFFEMYPRFSGKKIESMTKAQIYDAFRNSTIYVEFGHNPGKDRMPREAACSGCIVVARNKGGTAHFGDSPFSAEFKFDDDDVTSGKLAELLDRILSAPLSYWQRQSYYRRYLYSECSLMMLQTKRLFGRS